jgi:hypothetical protein
MSGISNYILNQKINAILGKSGSGGASNLDAVLTAGNSAGANDIDMNNNDILQLKNINNFLYFDSVNSRLGINVAVPTEDLELDGNFQLNTGSTSKIKFYNIPQAHENSEIDSQTEGTNGGNLQFYTKEDGGAVGKRITINDKGAIGIGDPPTYGGTNQVIVSQGSILPPRWRNNYPNIVSGFPVPPSANLYGDQILFNFTGSGNIGALMPMIWNGTTWKVLGSTTLCRWYSGSANQTISQTTITNITIGDYNTITFTPPITGYYEIGQNWFKWELNSGIGMSTYFSATDGSENYRLYYTEDWNGPYQHWRAGVSSPFVALLSSSKTYRFTANITFGSGNTGTLYTSGNTAYVKALAS